MKIERSGPYWRGEVTGTAKDLGKIEALQEIERLKANAKRSPLFKNVSVSHNWEADSLSFTLNFSLPYNWELRK